MKAFVSSASWQARLVNGQHLLGYSFVPVYMFLLVLLISPTAMADWTDARCDVYPKGEDHTDVSIACVFSQRQGYINIDRSDGISHDLSPQDDGPGHFRNQKGEDVYRKSGLGEAGQIFQFSHETVYVYWDTAGLPGNNRVDNYTAPYSTRNFNATARLRCSLADNEANGPGDCAAGINRGPENGQAVIAIMRPDGIERILQFDGEQVSSPGEGRVKAEFQSDEWRITINDTETYHIPLAAIEGG